MNQGQRISSGLGPVQPVSSLKLLLAQIVAGATPAFLDAIDDIEQAGIIPSVRDWAVGVLENATDAREFGTLKDDRLSAEGIAFLMGTSLISSALTHL